MIYFLTLPPVSSVPVSLVFRISVSLVFIALNFKNQFLCLFFKSSVLIHIQWNYSVTFTFQFLWISVSPRIQFILISVSPDFSQSGFQFLWTSVSPDLTFFRFQFFHISVSLNFIYSKFLFLCN